MTRNVKHDKIYMLESRIHQNFTLVESKPFGLKPDQKNAKTYLKAVRS